MAKVCSCCGKELKTFEARCDILKGALCMPCFEILGFVGMKDVILLADKPYDQVIALGEQRASNIENVENFVPTSTSLNGWIKRDDSTQLFLVKEKSTVLAKNTQYTCFRYDQLLEYELLEDGNSITRGGLARAIGGAALFGAAGAVVGGITGKRSSKSTCTRLEIKLTLRNSPTPTFYMTFYKGGEIKKNGFLFSGIQKSAEAALSELKVITDIIDKNELSQPNQSTVTFDLAEELRKFKGLLDDGIITQDEFDKKKKELLNQ